MISFYTAADSPFYSMVRGDETFLIEMYKYLLRYDNYVFQGRTYRATGIVTE